MPLTDWIELVEAVGIDASRFSEAQLYDMHGRILRDPVLDPEVRTKMQEVGKNGPLIVTRVGVIAAMKPQDRIALKTRVLAGFNAAA